MSNSVETLIQTDTPMDVVLVLVAMVAVLLLAISIIKLVVSAIYKKPLLVLIVGLIIAASGLAHAASNPHYEIGLIFTALGVGLVYISAATFNVRNPVKSGA